MGDSMEEEGGNPMGDSIEEEGGEGGEGGNPMGDENGVEALKSQLMESIEKHKERIQSLETSVFQLANYYFVFQGVFFTVVFNGSSHIKCHFRYLAFSLSIIAAFLNLVALLVIALRHQSLLSDLDAKVNEWNEIAAKKQAKESGWKRNLRLGLLILTVSLLALFAGFNLHGTWKNLCYENQQCILAPRNVLNFVIENILEHNEEETKNTPMHQQCPVFFIFFLLFFFLSPIFCHVGLFSL